MNCPNTATADPCKRGQKFRLALIATFGCMAVCRREWREFGLPRYIVMDKYEGRILEEFRRKREALRWAKKNSKG